MFSVPDYDGFTYRVVQCFGKKAKGYEYNKAETKDHNLFFLALKQIEHDELHEFKDHKRETLAVLPQREYVCNDLALKNVFKLRTKSGSHKTVVDPKTKEVRTIGKDDERMHLYFHSVKQPIHIAFHPSGYLNDLHLGLNHDEQMLTYNNYERREKLSWQLELRPDQHFSKAGTGSKVNKYYKYAWRSSVEKNVDAWRSSVSKCISEKFKTSSSCQQVDDDVSEFMHAVLQLINAPEGYLVHQKKRERARTPHKPHRSNQDFGVLRDADADDAFSDDV